MKIGILGTGNLGRSIGVRLAEVGHDVFFGARRTEEAELAVTLTKGVAQSGTIDQAARYGDVLFWMMREIDPSKVLDDSMSLSGKVVVDVNLRPFSGESERSAWFDTALGEELLENLPHSFYVKALTTVSMFTFDVPVCDLKTADVQTFMAGSDCHAKDIFSSIMQDAGIRAVDLGTGPVAIRAAEALGNVLRLMMGNGNMAIDGRFAISALPTGRLGHIGGQRPSTYLKGSVHSSRLPHLVIQ